MIFIQRLFILSCLLFSITAYATLYRIKNEKDFENYTQKYSKPIVVKFFAQWCDACQKSAKPFNNIANASEFKDIVFLEVDIDEVPILATKYGVNGIPAIYFFQHSKKIKDQVGFNSESQFKSDIRASIRTAFDHDNSASYVVDTSMRAEASEAFIEEALPKGQGSIFYRTFGWVICLIKKMWSWITSFFM